MSGVDVVPDTKDWTWVLQRACPECGVDTRTVSRAQVPLLIRGNAAAWEAVLASPGVRERPAPGVWSALEYGCHVRDVFRLFDQRLALMLTEDGPHYPNWDQDATAIAQRYGEQEPRRVFRDLRDAAETLAVRFESVSGPAWTRTGFRSDGARFTIESFARYLLHDPVHHLYDVTGRKGG